MERRFIRGRFVLILIVLTLLCMPTFGQMNSLQYSQFYTTNYQPSPINSFSGIQQVDIPGNLPSTLYFGEQMLPVPYSQYQSNPSYTGANSLWIKGKTAWTQYAVIPQGATVSLLTISPSGGIGNITIEDSNGQTYSSKYFFFPKSRLSFSAATIGRNMLSFAINGQSSNQVVIYVVPNTGTFFKDAIRDGKGELTIINDNPKMDAVVVLNPSNNGPTIINDPKTDAAVVLNPSNNGPKLAVYIRSTDSFTISGIKDGSYDMYFEIGNRWNSSSKKFTDKGGFYRLDRSLLFQTTSSPHRIDYHTWTVALESAAPNANEAGQKIAVNEEKFPVLK